MRKISKPTLTPSTTDRHTLPQEGINALLETTEVMFGDVGRVFGALSSGDLSQRIPMEGKDGPVQVLCEGVNALLDIGDARQFVIVMYVYRYGELLWRGPGPYR